MSWVFILSLSQAIPTGPAVTVFVGNITERAPDSMVSKFSVQLFADFRTFTIQVRHLLTTAGPVVSWKRVQGAIGELEVRNFDRHHCIAILFLLSNSKQN